MSRADAPGPMRRLGPRPLLLHLALAMLKSGDSPDGWRNWNPDSPNWKLAQDQMRAHLARLAEGQNAAPADAAAALFAQLEPNRDLIAGIAAYRRHPWRRDLADPPARWEEGGSRLLDYAPDATDRKSTRLNSSHIQKSRMPSSA